MDKSQFFLLSSTVAVEFETRILLFSISGNEARAPFFYSTWDLFVSLCGENGAFLKTQEVLCVVKDGLFLLATDSKA